MTCAWCIVLDWMSLSLCHSFSTDSAAAVFDLGLMVILPNVHRNIQAHAVACES